jgi:hypothetical protein
MSIMIRKTEAILSLLPNARFAMVDSTITVWEDDRPQPTDDEIDAEVTRLQAEYDSLAYARSRKQEYDKLPQFEMQFDDQRDGTSTWIDSINEIKERFPK